MSEKDEGKVQGWVEVIVKDKHGNIKYHIGTPPQKIIQTPKECKGENCPATPPIMSSLPAKLIELEYWRKNIITNVGLACIIRLMFYGLTEDKFRYLAIGTGTTAESATDTALQTEIKRKTATITQTTTSIEGDTALCEATFSSADTLSGSHNVSETGILNQASDGDLLARKVFTPVPVNWDQEDTLTIRYYIQMTR
jgi:hypothetical protein